MRSTAVAAAGYVARKNSLEKCRIIVGMEPREVPFSDR